MPEASASSDGLPTPALSAVPFPSSLSAAAQAHPAWSLSRGSEERQSSSLRSQHRRLQQIVYMEKMKLGFDNKWLLPPSLNQLKI